MADSTDLKALLEAADETFKTGKADAQLQALLAALEKNPENVDILWRIARVYYELGMATFENQQQQGETYKKGWEYAEKAVKLAPDSADTNKWAGALLGRYSDHLPVKEKIAQAFVIKTYFDTAHKHNPQDPIPIHSLGVWHMQVSSIGFVERNIAALLFATPPSSTYQNALDMFQKTQELVKDDPVWKGMKILNATEMAQCLEYMGDKNKAKEWYTKVLSWESEATEAQQGNLKKSTWTNSRY